MTSWAPQTGFGVVSLPLGLRKRLFSIGDSGITPSKDRPHGPHIVRSRLRREPLYPVLDILICEAAYVSASELGRDMAAPYGVMGLGIGLCSRCVAVGAEVSPVVFVHRHRVTERRVGSHVRQEPQALLVGIGPRAVDHAVGPPALAIPGVAMHGYTSHTPGCISCMLPAGDFFPIGAPSV